MHVLVLSERYRFLEVSDRSLGALRGRRSATWIDLALGGQKV
jgi:hypothetical protein